MDLAPDVAKAFLRIDVIFIWLDNRKKAWLLKLQFTDDALIIFILGQVTKQLFAIGQFDQIMKHF